MKKKISRRHLAAKLN